MADIFISYASTDRLTTRRLAEALEARGCSVWWDHRSLHGGQHFHRVIEKAILSARVVIVVWSQNSINSDWVLDEAALALDEKKLVPLRIDRAALPLRFRNIHTLDLTSWIGESEAEPFERLLETLGDYLGPQERQSSRAAYPNLVLGQNRRTMQPYARPMSVGSMRRRSAWPDRLPIRGTRRRSSISV